MIYTTFSLCALLSSTAQASMPVEEEPKNELSYSSAILRENPTEDQSIYKSYIFGFDDEDDNPLISADDHLIKSEIEDDLSIDNKVKKEESQNEVSYSKIKIEGSSNIVAMHGMSCIIVSDEEDDKADEDLKNKSSIYVGDLSYKSKINDEVKKEEEPKNEVSHSSDEEDDKADEEDNDIKKIKNIFQTLKRIQKDVRCTESKKDKILKNNQSLTQKDNDFVIFSCNSTLKTQCSLMDLHKKKLNTIITKHLSSLSMFEKTEEMKNLLAESTFPQQNVKQQIVDLVRQLKNLKKQQDEIAKPLKEAFSLNVKDKTKHITQQKEMLKEEEDKIVKPLEEIFSLEVNTQTKGITQQVMELLKGFNRQGDMLL